MASLRARTQDQIGRNALPLSQAPRKAPEASENPWPARAAGGALEGIKSGLKEIEKGLPAARSASEKAAKIIGSAHIHAPGVLFAGAQIAAAKDKKRAAFGAGGGWAGGALGEAVLGPPGAIVGSMAGEWAGEQLYDHRHQIADAVRDATRGLTQDVRNYAPLDRLPGNPYGL